MSATKPHQFRPPLYHKEEGRDARGTPPDSNAGPAANGSAGRERQGWEAYRKWLSSMNGKPQSRRAPIDHSVYSWKGYHSWADRVRQAWKTEET